MFWSAACTRRRAEMFATRTAGADPQLVDAHSKSMLPADPQFRRRGRQVLVGLVVVPLLTLAACAGGGASGKPPAPDQSVGTTLDSVVPADVLDAPLRDSTGHPTSLSAFRGKVIVLGDSLTLCQEICPLLSANFTSMARETDSKGLGNDVQFV